jgi:hypothetical protein
MGAHAQLLPEAANGLALAVVASSNEPLLLLDGEENVIAVSDSFSAAFLIDHDSAVGRPLSSLGGGEWKVPQLSALLQATASGFADVPAYE